MTVLDPVLDLGPKRSITITAVAGMFEELPGFDPALEVDRRKEVVIHPVGLAGPRGPGRCRNRELDFREVTAQSADQTSFADPGRAGDHKDFGGGGHGSASLEDGEDLKPRQSGGPAASA
jgi:hypothetical protein